MEALPSTMIEVFLAGRRHHVTADGQSLPQSSAKRRGERARTSVRFKREDDSVQKRRFAERYVRILEEASTPKEG